MRRGLIITLVLVAVGVYGTGAIRMLDIFVPRKAAREQAETAAAPRLDPEQLLRAARVVRFEEKGRSPFLAEKARPKPTVVKRAPVKRAPTKDIKPPNISITGIMWNPSNPVAMLRLPDGSSTVGKAGMTLAGGIEVVKVEKTGVKVRVDGNMFTIAK